MYGIVFLLKQWFIEWMIELSILTVSEQYFSYEENKFTKNTLDQNVTMWWASEWKIRLSEEIRI